MSKKNNIENDNIISIKGVTKRGENTYRFTVSDGFDGKGRQVRHTMTFRVPDGTAPTKAKKMVIEAYTDFSRRCKYSQGLDENMRFKELVDIFLRVYAHNELKPVTRNNYQRNLEMYMLPVYGNKKIKDITTQSLSDFFTGLEVAPETTRKLKIVMSSVFRFGVEQGYIKKNPCQGAHYKKATNEEQKIKFLTKEQCQRLMELTSEYSICNSIIQFLLCTGMRIGECLALRWEDIDFENNIISIKYTLTFADRTWSLSSPKTKTSTRYVAMSTYVKELLLRHKREQDKLKEVVGSEWKYPTIVFTSPIGNFYSRSYVNIYLKRLLSNNHMPAISVHGLRHSNASLLINDGFDVKAISEQLGHCNTEITSNIYVHIFKEYKAKMAESIDHTLV